MIRLSYNHRVQTVVFDTETEGLNLWRHRPWQLAWSVVVNSKVVETRELYPWFPDLKVGRMAAQITGFSYEKYRDLAVPKEEVWEEFAELLYDHNVILAGHNVIGFDSFMLRNLAMACGDWRGWKFMDRLVDTLCLSRIYNRGDRVDHNDFLSCQMREIGRPPKGTKKATLGAMAKAFEIAVDDTKLHNAAYDISLNAEVLNNLIYKLDF